MNNITIAGSILLGLAAFNPAYAQDSVDPLEYYAGASVSRFHIEYQDPAYLVSAIGGVQFNRYLAAEVRLGTGARISENVKQDLTVSLLGKVVVPISDEFSVYGESGYSRGKREDLASPHACLFNSGPCVYSHKDNGLTYGAGVSFDISDRASINLEYIHLYDMAYDDLSGISFAVTYKFE